MGPKKLLSEIEQFVDDSRTLLKQGAMMELAGLENRVMLLCEELILMSQDDRVHYAERLQKLMADLTSLGEEITAKRDEVGEKIRQLPASKKAYTAYSIIENIDDTKEEGE